MRHSLSTALPRIFSFACLSSFGKKFENEKCCFCNTLSKTTPRNSKQVAQRKISLRSSWLPFYRPCSFASQPFDCFAENIQFTLRSRFHFLDIILSHRAEPVNCLEQLSQKICFFEAFFRYACTSAAFLRSWSRSAASGWASALSKFSISISRLGAWLGCCSIFSYCWRTVMGILPWHI